MPQSLPLYATARQEAGVATSPRPRGRATSRCCTCCRRTLRQFSVSEAAAAARRKLPQLPTPASASHLLQLQLQLQRPAPAAIDDDDDDDPVLVVGGHTNFFALSSGGQVRSHWVPLEHILLSATAAQIVVHFRSQLIMRLGRVAH